MSVSPPSSWSSLRFAFLKIQNICVLFRSRTSWPVVRGQKILWIKFVSNIWYHWPFMIKRAAKREEGDFYETQELPETKQITLLSGRSLKCNQSITFNPTWCQGKYRRYYENYTLYFGSDEGTLVFCSEEWKMEGIEWESEGDYKVNIGKMKKKKKELF